MPRIHFLNVGNGDCSIIQHGSGRVTVIDVCKARDPKSTEAILEKALGALTGVSPRGNFNQKVHPENPIEYLQGLGVSAIFRFILTHPDMDHMDGLKALFEAIPVYNFWDTNNTAEKDFGAGSGGFNEDDWNFYQELRAGHPGTKRLILHDGDVGQFWNRDADNQRGGDGLSVLAPTEELTSQANDCEKFNDCSYVVLYRVGKFRVLFCGDASTQTIEHLLKHHRSEIEDVDILVAPHHGRHSRLDYDFLDVMRPTLTLFGNAPSEHLAYEEWNSRGLPFVTNNQAGNVVLDVQTDDVMKVLFSNETFARRHAPGASYDAALKAWPVWRLNAIPAKAA
ncbi:MAG: hypothetical protein SF187_28975 [Deltaproteobacteria bacterium]|nr:hypothetical protein [Deltaproteobacteria bacterium]